MKGKPLSLDFALSALLVVVFVLLVFFVFRKSTNHSAYSQIAFSGRIDSIYYYDKIFPVILINSRRLTLQIPTGCSEYLTKGDFISKGRNTKTIRVFRTAGEYLTSTLWGYGEEAKEDGFISSATVRLK